MINKTAIIFCTCAVLLTACTKAKDPLEQRSLAQQVSDSLDAGEYMVDMVITYPNGEQTPCVMKSDGEDGFVSLDAGGVYTEFYTVDKKTYALFPEIECYRDTGEEGAFGNALFKISSSDKLVSSSTDGEKVIERYESSGDSFTFIFNAQTNALERFEGVSNGETTRIDINSINFDEQQIEMPPLDSWADLTDPDNCDALAELKFTLYAEGITEEELNAAGYTIEDVSKLSFGELDSLIEKLTSKEE